MAPRRNLAFCDAPGLAGEEALHSRAEMTDGERQDESLEDRVPCTDDMCVGIIGPDGKCGTCGKPGTPPAPWSRPEHPHDDLHERGAAPEPEAAETAGRALAPASEPAPEPEPDSDERVPCLDDMCVGILGSDGTCGTCGKKWPRS